MRSIFFYLRPFGAFFILRSKCLHTESPPEKFSRAIFLTALKNFFRAATKAIKNERALPFVFLRFYSSAFTGFGFSVSSTV